MARLSKPKLLTQVTSAIEADGWAVTTVSQPGAHPLRLEMAKDGIIRPLRVYIWNMTHGGGVKRPRDEYRIQITKVTAFEPEPDGTTLILGWNEDFGVFAAFDITHHARPLGASPSIQIGGVALRAAGEVGAATQAKGNHEIALAVRPDRLTAYIDHFRDAHRGAIEAILEPAVDTVDFPALGGPERQHTFGHPAERAQRRSVLDRLEALEREIKAIRPQLGMMGHNRPPEAIEPDPAILADEVTEASVAIRQELAHDAPDPVTVARGASTLQRIWKLLRSAREEAGKFAHAVKEKARDKAAELVVAAVGGSVFYTPQIINALQAATAAVARWFHLIMG